MLAKSKLLVMLVLLALVYTLASSSTAKAQGASVVDVLRRDGRTDEIYRAIKAAGMEDMLRGAGPFTILAPIDGQFGAAGDANAARQAVMYHTVNSRVPYTALKGSASLTSALGNDIYVSNNKGVWLNDSARLVSIDLPASNGVIHLINRKLEPQGNVPAVAAEEAPSAAAEESVVEAETINSLAAPDPGNVQVHQPNQNPAFVSGGELPYWAGIHSDSSSCKGMTWTLLYQAGGVAQVGADRKSNPYRGDTSCATPLPILCINQNSAPAPSHQYSEGWAFGEIRATTPIQGLQLTSRSQADNFCTQAYGAGWRMAAYHDGGRGSGTGHVSGHDFWANGRVPTSTRFWVAIEDQAGNPWNSVNPKLGPPAYNPGPNIFMPGADPAFRGTGKLRMSMGEGVSAGRPGCQGMTWVLHKQINGKVQVGADHSSNPFVGDRSCAYAFPVLCIRVDGHAPPSNSHGEDYSRGWSGGIVKVSRAVTGHSISSRGAATQVCQDTFGSAWRMATFHDGLMGTMNTDGWEFWAYGTMPLGLRFWVGVNDQPANPWNP